MRPISHLGGRIFASSGPHIGRAAASERKEKSMHILGISAFYHDSAAALIRDWSIIAAAHVGERDDRSRLPSEHVLHRVGSCR